MVSGLVGKKNGNICPEEVEEGPEKCGKGDGKGALPGVRKWVKYPSRSPFKALFRDEINSDLFRPKSYTKFSVKIEDFS